MGLPALINGKPIHASTLDYAVARVARAAHAGEAAAKLLKL